jgi:Txe/YoeB family toxin of Txe-Axe toxin-antitoxin module
VNGKETYIVRLSSDAIEELARHEKDSNPSCLDRIKRMLNDLAINPRRYGIGKPKPLKHRVGDVWSRRIDERYCMYNEI